MIVACFASHLHRVQQAIQIAHLHGRKFAVSGRSMIKNVNIGRNLGILKVPDGAIIKLTEIDDYRPEEIAHPHHRQPGRAALGAHAHGVRRPPAGGAHEGRHGGHLAPRPSPATRLSVSNTINRLLKVGRGPSSTGRDSGVHVSGHGRRKTCA